MKRVIRAFGLLAEALTLGRKDGRAWGDSGQDMASNAIALPIIKAKAAPLASRYFSPTFTVQTMRKGVGPLPGTGTGAGACEAMSVPLGQTALAVPGLPIAAAYGAADGSKTVGQTTVVDCSAI